SGNSASFAAPSGGFGSCTAHQMTVPRYTTGTFMISIRKIKAHHSPDIRRSVLPGPTAEEPRPERVHKPAAERRQGHTRTEGRARHVPGPLEREQDHRADRDAEARPAALLRDDAEDKPGDRERDRDRQAAEQERDHESPHAVLPSGASTVSARACAASGAHD